MGGVSSQNPSLKTSQFIVFLVHYSVFTVLCFFLCLQEEKKPEEKKPEEQKPVEKVAGEGEEKKKEEEEVKEEAPAPPPEIVLRVFMHCEGCARKVKKCLKGFNGVEDVVTDCKNHTVVVKGEKADPVKVQERVQRKSHRQVELLSPVPVPAPAPEGDAKKVEEKEAPKEEKKEEPKAITVVLKVHMHCEACAQEIKKRIEKMKEVEVATPDLKNSEVTVKGTFDPQKLVDYIYKRTGKQASIVKQDPPIEEEKKEESPKEKTEEEKKENGDEKKEKPEEEKKEEGEVGEEDVKLVEMRRNELFYYPPKYGMQMYHSYPPQIFSDENPNACSVM